MTILKNENLLIERYILSVLDEILKAISHARIDMDNIYHIKDDESCSIEHLLEALLYVFDAIENKISKIIKESTIK